MKNPKLITAIVAVVIIGAVIATGIYIYGLNTKPDAQNQRAGDTTSAVSSDSQLTELEAQYAAMKGEDYDRAFITDMVAHHQGAVAMAYPALEKAKYPELKTLAQGIIDSQLGEIRNMETWKKDWGYTTASQGSSGGMTGMDHSGGAMEQDMAKMTNDLNKKTGDEFDKAFLQLMIEHHESAIAMARPGITNAEHKELKDLTLAIVGAQTQEIAQMKQWQKDWGYEAQAAWRE